MKRIKTVVTECESYLHRWTPPCEIASYTDPGGKRHNSLHGVSMDSLGFKLPMGCGDKVRKFRITIEDLGLVDKGARK